jgi:hypothetical protein
LARLWGHLDTICTFSGSPDHAHATPEYLHAVSTFCIGLQAHHNIRRPEVNANCQILIRHGLGGFFMCSHEFGSTTLNIGQRCSIRSLDRGPSER